jgi:predicted enzyme related to lactoylglutathione lyase
MDGVPSGGNGTIVYFTCTDCAVELREPERRQSHGKDTNRPAWISLVTDTEGNVIDFIQ